MFVPNFEPADESYEAQMKMIDSWKRSWDIKDEPIKPAHTDAWHWYCGECGCRIPLKIKAHYCHKCGYPIDWTERKELKSAELAARTTEESR